MRNVLSCLLLITVSTATLAAENWPQWRGPAGTGVSSERDIPLIWSDTRSLRWKCELPGWGASTPAVWGDAIFVTGQAANHELWLARIDKRTGKFAWQKTVGQGETPREAPKRLAQKFHALHNFASPSPVTDGKVVVVHFGNGDFAAYDFAGEQLWKRNLQDDFGSYTNWYGHANSPVLFQQTVISVCMQDSLADLQETAVESYIIAHDLRTGRERWKTVRKTRATAEQCDSYTTPLLAKLNDRQQLIVMGANQLDGYDPVTGRQLWYLPNLTGGRLATGPTTADGLIFATRGLRGPLFAVKPTGEGELPRKSIAWEHADATPDSCSPVVWGEFLFTITDDGIARCLHAETGNTKWKHRLPGNYKASPVAVEGRVYFLNTAGMCTVLSAAPYYDKLTENQLTGEFVASPAISGGTLLLRGKQFLYGIEK